MVVLETLEEWVCIRHWVLTAYQSSYQRFAISLKKKNFSYVWVYADGSEAFPDYSNYFAPLLQSTTEHSDWLKGGNALKELLYC